MLVIKSTTVDQSTSPNPPNSFGKVNKTFVHFVVEFLSLSLLFDCWFDHSSQTSPAPFAKKVPREIYRDLTRNRNAIVNYCIHHGLGITGMYDLLLINLYISNFFTFKFICFNDFLFINLYTSKLLTFNLYVFFINLYKFNLLTLNLYVLPPSA
jgi:hypothetical protein